MMIILKDNRKGPELLYELGCFFVRNQIVSITGKKHMTNTSCSCNDGTSKDNLYFDDQSKKVDFSFFVAVFSKRNRNTHARFRQT